MVVSQKQLSAHGNSKKYSLGKIKTVKEQLHVFIAVGMRARAAALLWLATKGTGAAQEIVGVTDYIIRKPDRFDCFLDDRGKEGTVTRFLPLGSLLKS